MRGGGAGDALWPFVREQMDLFILGWGVVCFIGDPLSLAAHFLCKCGVAFAVISVAQSNALTEVCCWQIQLCQFATKANGVANAGLGLSYFELASAASMSSKLLRAAL
jgi:hypothetical protein